MDAAKKKNEYPRAVKAKPSSAANSASAEVIPLSRPEALLSGLERWRTALGVSREKFAVTTLNVSHSTYERWLRGGFNPRYKDMVRYEALLANSDLIPPRMSAASDPVLAKIWDNPLDAEYDNY